MKEARIERRSRGKREKEGEKKRKKDRKKERIWFPSKRLWEFEGEVEPGEDVREAEMSEEGEVTFHLG